MQPKYNRLFNNDIRSDITASQNKSIFPAILMIHNIEGHCTSYADAWEVQFNGICMIKLTSQRHQSDIGEDILQKLRWDVKLPIENEWEQFSQIFHRNLTTVKVDLLYGQNVNRSIGIWIILIISKNSHDDKFTYKVLVLMSFIKLLW